MKSIFLFGPFIGSLLWEFFRFAPYMIYIKKKNPKCQIAVLTRQERFDLYGKYVNYLVPLKLKGDDVKKQRRFKLDGYDLKLYRKLTFQFHKMYSKRFDIKKHFFPDIIDYRYKIRWQFPRKEMDYNFLPRSENDLLIKKIFSKKPFILIIQQNDKFISEISRHMIKNKLTKKYNIIVYGNYKSNNTYNINDIDIGKESSQLGILIEIIRKSKLVIGPKCDLTHLSILLKTPIVTWGNKSGIDLLNPLKTKISIYNRIPSADQLSNQIIKELGRRENETDYNCI